MRLTDLHRLQGPESFQMPKAYARDPWACPLVTVWYNYKDVQFLSVFVLDLTLGSCPFVAENV
jgi:hypothetical protein